jgi:hypothetical protein
LKRREKENFPFPVGRSEKNMSKPEPEHRIGERERERIMSFGQVDFLHLLDPNVLNLYLNLLPIKIYLYSEESLVGKPK